LTFTDGITDGHFSSVIPPMNVPRHFTDIPIWISRSFRWYKRLKKIHIITLLQHSKKTIESVGDTVGIYCRYIPTVSPTGVICRYIPTDVETKLFPSVIFTDEKISSVILLVFVDFLVVSVRLGDLLKLRNLGISENSARWWRPRLLFLI